MDYDNNLQNKVKHIRSFDTCTESERRISIDVRY